MIGEVPFVGVVLLVWAALVMGIVLFVVWRQRPTEQS